MTLQNGMITKTVEKVLEKDSPSIFSLINDVASPRKVAKKMLPIIKSELNFEPGIGTVAKVIERYVDKLKEGKEIGYDIEKVKQMVARTQIVLRSDVGIVSTNLESSVGKKLLKVVEFIHSKSSKPFINISFGHSHITIIIDEANLEQVRKIFGKGNIIYFKKNRAALSFVNPSEVKNTVGFASYIFNLLGMAGINVNDILSSYNEGILIMEENDASDAYKILKNEINRLRKYYSDDSE